MRRRAIGGSKCELPQRSCGASARFRDAQLAIARIILTLFSVAIPHQVNHSTGCVRRLERRERTQIAIGALAAICEYSNCEHRIQESACVPLYPPL